MLKRHNQILLTFLFFFDFASGLSVLSGDPPVIFTSADNAVLSYIVNHADEDAAIITAYVCAVGTAQTHPDSVVWQSLTLVEPEPADCPGDFDGDGAIGLIDLSTMLSLFGTFCN